jgi:hypothetical protein
MGLAPFSNSNKVSVHTKQNKSTKGLLSPNVLWSFFVFLIQLTGFMAVMIWNILYDYRKYTLSLIIPGTLTILTMYSTCFASVIGAVFNRRRMEILKMNFTAIDQILLQEIVIVSTGKRDGFYCSSSHCFFLCLLDIVVIMCMCGQMEHNIYFLLLRTWQIFQMSLWLFNT